MQKNNGNIIREITPLTEEDCLYVVSRYKHGFEFPVHYHTEYELNYMEGAAGAERVVGDSIETVGDYDLVLIGSSELEHGWINGAMDPDTDVFEITIQFNGGLIPEKLLEKKQFASLKNLFEQAARGVSFSLPAILKCKPLLNSLTCETKGFYTMTTFLNLLYELSLDTGMRTLSSQSFAHVEQMTRSRRVKAVCSYIDKHYASPIHLKDLADLTNMSEGALSRFFRQQTGTSVSDYIVEQRIGKAARELVETNKPIAEICYSTGYNNISNFNRLFKKLKNCTPREFRDAYRKNQLLV